MARGSSDFDLAEDFYLLELLDWNAGEDLQQLDVAEQLQLQDAIVFSFKETSSSASTPVNTGASSSMPMQKPRKSAIKAGESTLKYCEICVDKKEREQLFTTSGCSHLFCSDCVGTCVKSSLEQKKTIITCPGKNCTVLLEFAACRPQLPQEVINLWEDLLREKLLCATGGRL